MSKTDVLVAGAGLAGLSAAFHLGDRDHRIVEAESEVGGLCRSIRERGYTFDYTGHLLHLRRPEVKELVRELLPADAFLQIDRRSGIRSHGVFTDYPFQVNTHGLPRAVVRECVMGFAETLNERRAVAPEASFHEWSLASFGPGLCRHFLHPYNEKLLRADLRTVSSDWVSWAVPKPSWPDVVRGALGTNQKKFGYNPQFLYPAAAGIDHLPRAFLPRIRSVELGSAVVAIDAGKREARMASGETIAWKHLVSSLPLPALVARIEGAPGDLVAAAAALRHVSVLNLNLGFDRPATRPDHWIYFPGADVPFYRVGIYSNLCPASVPEGRSAFYVEVSFPPGRPPEIEPLVASVADDLRREELLPESAKLEIARVLAIPHAYVVHDEPRKAALARIHAWLGERGIRSIGRYGAWEYSAMEDALWHGREVAARILGS